MGGDSCLSVCVNGEERGRGCRQGIDGRTAGEERRGEGGAVERPREWCVVPPGGSAADRGSPGKDRDRRREELAGEAVSGKRGVGSGAAAPAVGSRARLVAGGVPGVGTVDMAAVGVATAARLRSCVRRAVGRGCVCPRARMLPPGAAAAVIVGERGEQAGRQMHDQAQGHEAATRCASAEHGTRANWDTKIRSRIQADDPTPKCNRVAIYPKPAAESTAAHRSCQRRNPFPFRVVSSLPAGFGRPATGGRSFGRAGAARYAARMKILIVSETSRGSRCGSGRARMKR
jgi:hypothetical protein